MMSVSSAGIVVGDKQWTWAKVKPDYRSLEGRMLLFSSASGASVAFRFKEWECYGGNIFLDWVEWFRESSRPS